MSPRKSIFGQTWSSAIDRPIFCNVYTGGATVRRGEQEFGFQAYGAPGFQRQQSKISPPAYRIKVLARCK